MDIGPKMKFMERLVLRLGAGVLAFLLGLVFFSCWSSFHPPRQIKEKPQEDTPEVSVDDGAALTLRRPPGVAGNGITKRGVRFSFTSLTDSDGVQYMQWTEEHRSPRAARRALQQALKTSVKIVKRVPLRDENDQVVGERIIATFSKSSRYGKASLLWTNGSTFRFVATSELKSLLESQKE